MALDQYSDLLTAAANWAGRSDLTSRIPEFLELTEAKINRKLRTKDMETKNAAFSITGEYVALPTGFGGVRSFHLNTSPRQVLEFMSPDAQTGYFGQNTGRPRFYSIEGSNFRFGPIPDGTYSSTLTYFLTVPALTGSATTNWLLTANPDVYVYGINGELAAYLKDFEAAQGWEARMYSVLQEIHAISNQDKWGGNSMAVRLG
jgi:hypothetical protein